MYNLTKPYDCYYLNSKKIYRLLVFGEKLCLLAV
jgi:hypothetical protein